VAGFLVNTVKAFDLLGLGCAAVDDLVYVEAYPPADAKVSVVRSERQCGGLTATALVAASRLGSRCAFAGVLGTDEWSQYGINRLREEGIDLTYLRQRPEAKIIHSFIVVDTARNTRNIFADLNGAVGCDPDWPEEDIIRSARVLLVDHFGLKGMIRAARIARAAGIPIVADFEKTPGTEFPTLLDLVDHLIVSQHFAERLTQQANPQDAVKALWTDQRDTVVVTCGAEGCWYSTHAEPARVAHQPAFRVRVADTTGCGDVFHGAYAAALGRGLPVEERIRFASATAALKATQKGGQEGIPRQTAVDSFLQENK